MQFERETVESFTVVRVTGRLDAISAPELDAQTASWLEENLLNVVLDMSGVEYISSAGLRSILAAAKQLKAKGGVLRFCGLTGMVAEVFTVSGFASLFEIFETCDQAVS